jgi:hypothetical protein
VYGTWMDGTWENGVWKGGIWRGGIWKGIEDRLKYHASCAGLVFDGVYWLGYRTTTAGGRGRYASTFTQQEGYYEELDIPRAGAGCCIPGIHITSAARAWTYFGVDPTCVFWSVRVLPQDLLDCDGEKARIRAGVFTRIERPF